MDRFSNFASHGPTVSVPSPVVMNGDKCDMFRAASGCN